MSNILYFAVFKVSQTPIGAPGSVFIKIISRSTQMSMKFLLQISFRRPASSEVKLPYRNETLKKGVIYSMHLLEFVVHNLIIR